MGTSGDSQAFAQVHEASEGPPLGEESQAPVPTAVLLTTTLSAAPLLLSAL